VLGFGSKPPPLALHLKKLDEETIQAAIRAVMSDMKQRIVWKVLEGLGDIIKRETSLLILKNTAPLSFSDIHSQLSSQPFPNIPKKTAYILTGYNDFTLSLANSSTSPRELIHNSRVI
jgi:hypothetical protein